MCFENSPIKLEGSFQRVIFGIGWFGKKKKVAKK